MKKLLIGTTALVAVGMAADGAFAAEKIKLGLGGYFRAYFVAGDQTVNNYRGHGVARESEVYFTGETTLDNGLRVGAAIQLEGETSTDQIDNSWIWFKGGWGDLRFGSFWGPGVAMHYAQAGDKLSGHGNFASFNHLTAPTGNTAGVGYETYAWRGGNDDKIVYYSPRFGGVQIGIGYAPDATEESASALKTDNDTGQNSETWDAGINFQQKFGDFSLGLSGNYVTESTETTGSSADPNTWALGSSFGFAGFTASAAYRKTDNDTTSNVGEQKVFELGVGYGMGPWAVGATVASKKVKAAAGDDKLLWIQLSGRYAIGPGVNLEAGIQRLDWEDDANVSTAEGDSTIFIIGTALSF